MRNSDLRPDHATGSRSVIIVGVPRSGTSMAAAVFARRGYFCGRIRQDRLREGDHHNPFGYFEADDLVERNVLVLARAGFGFHNTWVFDRISAEQIDRIRELDPSKDDQDFLAAYEEKRPWCWKDPRLCFTLSYWGKLLDPETTGVVLVRRDAADIYWSFRRFGWTNSREDVERRVEQHLAAAQKAIRSLAIPHVVVDYVQFLKEPDLVARRLGEVSRLDVRVEDLNVHPDLDHSGFGGRLSTELWRLLRKLPRERVRRIETLFPRRLVEFFFSERRYLRREIGRRAR